MKTIHLILSILLIVILANIQITIAQNVGINDDGSEPNPSAILDVKSTSKGLLIPSVALQSGTLPIANPVEGLLVYNNDASYYEKGFYYWNTTQNDWVKLVINPELADNDATNEIQDLQLNAHILTITKNGTATEIDLSAYLDNTTLTETEVDNFVANNGYITSEVTGSVNAKDGFGTKLWNVSSEQFETATVNTEYISPNQLGDIYGTIYRFYWSGNLTDGTDLVTNATAIIGGDIQGRDASNRFRYGTRYHDGTNIAGYKLTGTSGSGVIEINKSSVITLIDGWVDYTK